MLRKENWNLPNCITLARIVLTPGLLVLLFADGGALGGWRWAAAAFFVVAIATDALDGYLARSRGLITDLGKLLDPIADKFLTGAALVGLALLAELPWWVVALVLVREVGITVHRLVIAGSVVVAADWMGKVKTVLQSVAIAYALTPLGGGLVASGGPLWVLGVALMSLAVFATVASGIDYVVAAARRRGE